MTNNCEYSNKDWRLLLANKYASITGIDGVEYPIKVKRSRKPCEYVIKSWDMYGKPTGLLKIGWDDVEVWYNEDDATDAFASAIELAENDPDAYSALELVNRTTGEMVDDWETRYELPEEEEEDEEEEEEEEEETSSICNKCGCCFYDMLMPEKWRIELTGKAEFCSCE